MNTLTYGATTLNLPDDLMWTDEFAWQAVEQRVKHTITGALRVESFATQAGRSITLEGGDDFAWAARSVVETLGAWRLFPAQSFELVLRDEPARTVVFDHQAGAIDVAPVIDYSDVDSADYYRIKKLRFIEV